MMITQHTIHYRSDRVQADILALPDTLAARYLFLTRRMLAIGPNLGEPHTKAVKDGLFELRLKGQEGIARVFYCTLVGKRIVMLHSFIKKTNRTPAKELATAMRCLKECKHEKP
jgi:phage-related protein